LRKIFYKYAAPTALKTRPLNPYFIRIQSVADFNFRFSFSLFRFAFTLTA